MEYEKERDGSLTVTVARELNESRHIQRDHILCLSNNMNLLSATFFVVESKQTIC